MARRKRDIPRFTVEPIGHILGTTRLALVVSPYCHRRMRIVVEFEDSKWVLRRFQMCPCCRRIWRLKGKITRNGFLRRLNLELAI